MALADLFCRQVRQRVEAAFRELWHNTDAHDVALAKRVTAGEFTDVEHGILPLPTAGAWVEHWEPGPSTATDVRRRLPR